MFNTIFTLRQHTPMLHFQYEQTGATLRATELKSKLDRFLVASLTDCYSNEAKVRLAAVKQAGNTDWLQQRDRAEQPAFDYTVKITADPTGHYWESANGVRLYFGNMGDDNKSQKHLVFHDFVRVEFHSTNQDLLDYIQTQFPKFLLNTNFGTRQSKGFGSYYLVEPHATFHQDCPQFAFDVDVSSEDSEPFKMKRLYEVIELFYKTLRSGINDIRGQGDNKKTVFYCKSMLWSYLQSLGIQWDKKTIKKAFFIQNEEAEKEKQEDRGADEHSPLFYEEGKKQSVPLASINQPLPSHLLWRDILGLSTEQSWHSYRATITKKHLSSVVMQSATGNNGELRWNTRLEDRKDASDFSRMASPFFFKPLRTGENSFRVFFDVPLPIRQAFRGERQDIAISEILGSWFKVSNRNDSIALPFPQSFDFDAFFTHAFSVNLREHVERRYQNRNDFHLLNNIYSTLNAQINQ